MKHLYALYDEIFDIETLVHWSNVERATDLLQAQNYPNFAQLSNSQL